MFMAEIWLIIPKLSLLPNFICKMKAYSYSVSVAGLLNPLLTSELVHPYHLGESISKLSGF